MPQTFNSIVKLLRTDTKLNILKDVKKITFKVTNTNNLDNKYQFPKRDLLGTHIRYWQTYTFDYFIWPERIWALIVIILKSLIVQ